MTSFKLQSSTPPELGNDYGYYYDSDTGMSIKKYNSPYWNAMFYSVVSGNIISGLKIYVPEGSLSTYTGNSQWNEYSGIIYEY
jgi:hypothetical protein